MSIFFGIAGGLFLVGTLGVALLVLRLSQGPIEITGLHERIGETLQRQFESRGQISIGRTFIARGPHGPTLRLENFSLKDNQDRTLVAAPAADISVAPFALLTGRLAISGLEFSGLDVKLAVLPDGTMAFSAGKGDAITLKPAGSSPPLNPGDILAAIFAATARDAPFFGELQRIGLTDGRLDVDDRRLENSITFTDLNLSIDRLLLGGVDLAVSARGESGPFSIKTLAYKARSFDAANHETVSYRMEFQAKDLPVHELALASGFGHQPVEISMPLSAKGSMSLDADGKLQAIQSSFALGAGRLRFDDPEAKPILADEILGNLSFDPSNRRILVPVLEYFAGLTHIKASGFIEPASTSGNDHHLSLSARDVVLSPERDGDKVISIDSVELQAATTPDFSVARIDKLAVKGAEIDATYSQTVHNTPEGPAIAGTLDVTKTRYNAVMRLWPSFIAPDLLLWMAEHVSAGVVEKGSLKFDLDAQNLIAAKAKLPVPDASLNADIAVSGGTMTPLPGLVPITGLEGSGHFTATTAAFVATKAGADVGKSRLNLSDIRFSIPDTTPKKLTPAMLSGHIQGNVDAVVDLLSRDALRKFNNVPGEPSQYKGQIDGTLDIAFMIGKTATPDDVSVKANFTTTNLSVEKVVATERLDNANLAINVTKTSMSVKGDGRMFGAPVSLELKKSGAAPTDASLIFTLDDAARQKRGLDFGGAVTGPVLIKATTQLADGDRSKTDVPKGETRAQLDVDLVKTSIDGLLPGWTKLSGKPGHMAFALTSRENTIQLDQFQLDAGNASIRGAITLDGAAKLSSAKLTSFRLAPQDDVKLDVQMDNNVLKLVARGSAVDARPLISDLLAHSRAKSANGLDYDLDLKINSITGFNKEKAEGLDLKMRRRAGVIQKVQAAGKIGGASFKITPLDGGAFALKADNAGAVLSFLDMYRRMEGGSLGLTLNPDVDHIAGAVQIQNFVLNDEPAIRQLLNQNNAALSADGQNRVRFSRLQGKFERSDGRIDLEDAAMYGPQIGATMQGMIDYGKDQVDLSGNLIPAYQVNNMFSKIPLFGPLLGGGKNEGLFAINYRITGKASAPFLRVDPLSAIAPGILRKIMGVADGTATNPDNFGPANKGAPAPPAEQPPAAPLDLNAPMQ